MSSAAMPIHWEPWPGKTMTTRSPPGDAPMPGGARVWSPRSTAARWSKRARVVSRGRGPRRSCGEGMRGSRYKTCLERLRRPGRHDERDVGLGARAGALRPLVGLFEDGVGVGAAHAERRDGGALHRRPVQSRASVSSSTAPSAQSTWGVGASTCRVLGSTPWRIAMTILMTPPTPDAGLGVPDVRLQRAEPRRVVAVLAVGGDQRLGLDRVAERGPGAVGLDGVDLLRGQARVGERLADDALLRGAVRRGEAVGRAVLVDRRALITASTGWPWASASERRSTTSRPAPSPQPVPSAGGRERLAAAVGGQAALLGELDERRRRRHHGHAARQRHRALAAPQRLHGQVQRDQRRRTRRVDRDGRALQPEGVGEAAGDDRARVAGGEDSCRSRRRRSAGSA